MIQPQQQNPGLELNRLVPFEVFQLAVNFFLDQNKFGKFIRQGQPTDPAGTAQQFTQLVNDFVQQVYAHGYFDGHNAGIGHERAEELRQDALSRLQ